MSQLPVKVLRRITSRFAAIVLVAALGLLSATSALSADKDGVKRVDAGAAGLPLLFFDDFESGKAGHWAPGDGNCAWNEWTIANGNSNSATNLNRKVASLGTKAAGSSWTLTVTITVS